ncbi:glycosyltransferase family 2 protein [Pedobacter sp. KBS0701]|uniref:glycosyltransferase family A protein n=1 Tax=Pedobacter sp. KBS0701 TaxID=2578106 RepID=UPI00110D9E03|nr:glycosyltransferase family A protein [Pedobacter sp. KBS0701]QDW25515.1 glycosyltransferase family 2 protein [Pedobacter sp. KBS0701]
MKKKEREILLPVYFISDVHLAGKGIEHRMINEQFSSKKEFELKFSYLKPVNSDGGNYDEWEQVIAIIKDAQLAGDHAIILARSSHVFSASYSFERLLEQILNANRLGAKILYGNASAYHDALYLSKNLFWVHDVGSTSFVVLYRSVFENILAHSAYVFGLISFEVLLSEMTSNKLITCPFIGDQDTEEKQEAYATTETEIKRIKSTTLKYKKDHPFLGEKHIDTPATKLVLNGSIRAPFTWDSAEQVFVKGLREEKIIVLVPFHNAGTYLKECFQSLSTQLYANFNIFFLDDYSTDKALDEVVTIPGQVEKIYGEARAYALNNIYNCLKNLDCSGEEIILIVDGDDYLYHNHVFKNINYLYQRQGCLLSYGQYYSTTNHLGHCKPYSNEEFGILRQLDWRASHLKTFKFKLFREYISQDPEASAFKDNKGDFYEMTYDMALMTPLMEIAGFHKCYFNEDVNYIYRIHEKNDAARNRALQIQIEQEIRLKPCFKPVFEVEQKMLTN